MILKAKAHCRQQALLEYLEGEGTPQERQAVEAHLETCPSCRERLRGFKATLELVDLPAPPAANPLYASSFLHQVRRGIGARQARRQYRRCKAGLVAMGCAAALWWGSAGLEGPLGTERESAAAYLYVEEHLQAAALFSAPEDELAASIEAYLLETASTEELIRQVQGLGLVAFREEY
jgi:anti-sigma factor RsiW